MERKLQRFPNVSPGLRGDVSGLWGNISGLWGEVTKVTGNVDDCELTASDREKGVAISDLIKEAEATDEKI